jgi:thiamine pyrophosphate-dependent acetolactate synthase large subunit-like protein
MYTKNLFSIELSVDKVSIVNLLIIGLDSFSNGIPGLATAFADRSSIFCVTSSAPLRDAETNSLQDAHDQVVIARSITKFAHRVSQVEEIPRLVAHAFRVSVSGAPGGFYFKDSNSYI